MSKHLTLRQCRENRFQTVEQAAKRSGLTVREIEKIEEDSGRAEAAKVMTLCAVYQISPEHIFFGRSPGGQLPCDSTT